jgi:hypothetical protein
VQLCTPYAIKSTRKLSKIWSLCPIMFKLVVGLRVGTIVGFDGAGRDTHNKE